MIKTQKGFSIVELMIATGILGVIALVVNEFIFKTSKELSSYQGKMSISRDVNQVLNQLTVDLNNLARLTDKGVESESFNEGDHSYLGVYGLSAADATKLPQCHYEAPGSESGFSILRYTTINQQRPSKLLKFWHDNTVPLEDLIIGRNDDVTNQVFSDLVKTPNQKVSMNREILLIDGDGFTTSRKLVVSGEYIESTKDPYDNVDKAPVLFRYYRLRTEEPGHFKLDSTSQVPLSHQFITGSYVYGVSTKIICVSSDKNHLLLIDELAGSSRKILNPVSDQAQFSYFLVNYISPTELETTPMGLPEFPTGPDLAIAQKRRCIDQISIRMGFKKGSSTLTYSHPVFIGNYNSKRPEYCF